MAKWLRFYRYCLLDVVDDLKTRKNENRGIVARYRANPDNTEDDLIVGKDHLFFMPSLVIFSWPNLPEIGKHYIIGLSILFERKIDMEWHQILVRMFGSDHYRFHGGTHHPWKYYSEKTLEKVMAELRERYPYCELVPVKMTEVIFSDLLSKQVVKMTTYEYEYGDTVTYHA